MVHAGLYPIERPRLRWIGMIGPGRQRGEWGHVEGQKEPPMFLVVETMCDVGIACLSPVHTIAG